MKCFLALPCALALLCSCARIDCDVCVYGCTSAGVMAAVSAARMGADVVLVGPDMMPGGMSSGGLGFTDIGNKQAVTGLARQFYRRVGEHYGKLESWVFEPHVAENIFREYLSGEERVQVFYGHHLCRVSKCGTRIRRVVCEGPSEHLSIRTIPSGCCISWGTTAV